MIKTCPLVSVIVPAYNRLSLVKLTLNSLLQQQCDFSTEIIVIDDGSKDGTFDILTKEYCSDISSGKLRIMQQRNNGPAKARNFGIQEAKGEYIAFCDSDDISEPHRLAEQISFLKKNPEKRLVHTKALWIDGSGIKINDYLVKDGIPMHYQSNIWDKLRSGENSETLLLNGINPIHASSVMARKELLQEIKKNSGHIFNNQLSFAEDFDLWLRVAEIARHQQKSFMGFLDKFCIRYRRHGNNITEYNQSNSAVHAAISLFVKTKSARRRLVNMQNIQKSGRKG